MAVKINGKKVSAGIVSKHVTLPLCGMYIAKTKANDAYNLYIDHFTGADKIHRSYKTVFIQTKDSDSLFNRLCRAFLVKLPSPVTQQAAAELLAAAMAEFGALKCVRTGKSHDWTDIHPVSLEVDALPWAFPEKTGMVLKSLWNVSDDETVPEDSIEESYPDDTDADLRELLVEMGRPRFTLIGKSIDDIIEDVQNREGGVPLNEVKDALDEAERLLNPPSCYKEVLDLYSRALGMGMTSLRLVRKAGSNV